MKDSGFWNWRGGPVVTTMGCARRASEFVSQDPHGDSYQPGTPVPENPLPSSRLNQDQKHMSRIAMKGKHPCTYNKISKSLKQGNRKAEDVMIDVNFKVEVLTTYNKL